MDSMTRVEDHKLDVIARADQPEKPQLEPPVSSDTFSKIVTQLVMSQTRSSTTTNTTLNTTASKIDTNNKLYGTEKSSPEGPQVAELSQVIHMTSQPQPSLKRSCRAPSSRKLGHPCSCGQSNHGHHKLFSSSSSNNNRSLPPSDISSPLYLYDPISKKCLPTVSTTRNRDMLLRECQSQSFNTFPANSLHASGSSSCLSDDLVCDPRRFRCICRPPLHLYYVSNQTSFGCVPLGRPSEHCGLQSNYVYNPITKDCQKIFDVNELPPSYPSGVSATQFSFVTIVLIWVVLLVLIVAAKLRKLRTSNLYRSPTSADRRYPSGSYGHQAQNTSTWLHPFIAAVNGHHHLNQHRTTVDRHSRTLDESGGNYNDTDYFLSNRRGLAENLHDTNHAGSQQSLNHPPPKFEELYPAPVLASRLNGNSGAEIRPSSIEDLPSYDEAMKLQDTTPHNTKE